MLTQPPALIDHSTYLLPTIVITAPKTPAQTKNLHSNLNLNNSNGTHPELSLNKTSFGNIENIINQYSSVKINTNGAGNEISIRGFGDNAGANTKIIYNHIVLNTPSLAGPNLNLINPALLSQYQIKSSSSGENNAVGGRINFSSFNKNLTETQPNAQPTVNSLISIGQPSDENFLISAKNLNTNTNTNTNINFFTTHKNTDRVGESSEVAQFALGVHTQNVKNHNNFTDLFIQAGPEYENYPGALTQEQMNQNRNQIGDYPGHFESENFLSSIFHQHYFNTDLKNTWLISYITQQGTGIWTRPNQPDDVYTESFQTLSIKPSLTDIHPNIIYLNQVNLSETLSASTYQTTGLNQAQSWDSNTALKLRKNFNHWIIQLNAHFITFESDDTLAHVQNHGAFPIAGFSAEKIIHQNFHMTYTLQENYRLPLVDENSDTLANTQLKPQTGLDNQIKFSYIPSDKNFNLNLTLYQLILHHEIAYIPAGVNPDNPWGANINLPQTNRTGLIFNNKINLNTKFSIQDSISFLNNQIHATHKTIPWTAPILGEINTIFKLNTSWKFYFGTNYTGKEYPSNDVENQTKPLPGYFIFNSGIGYQTQTWQCILSIQNLLNKKYDQYVLYTPTGNDYYPGSGINILLSLDLINL